MSLQQLNYKQPIEGTRIVEVLTDYVSSVSNKHITELLKVAYLDNVVELYVHYWCNGDDFYLEVIEQLPYANYTDEQLISIYNERREYVIDYV